jgi:hypothetical protein
VHNGVWFPGNGDAGIAVPQNGAIPFSVPMMQ